MQLVSIIIPCFNESDALPHLRLRLGELAAELEPRYTLEFVLVDDGSKDDTWRQIAQFARADARFRGFRLSRNFGHQAALTCGYNEARGDAVVSLDADMQDPPEVVVEMIEEWRKGADVVLAVRRKREGETRFKLLTARLFYKLLSMLSDTEIRNDAGDFRLMSRRAVDAFKRLGERRRYIRGMVGWIGFDAVEVPYDRKPRVAGVSKYPLSRMLSFATDGLLSFSFAPLRLAFAFAAVGSVPIVCYLAFSFLMHIFFHGHFEPGWASLMLTITVFSVLNLICLGLVGEYVGRLYDEAKGRPLYLLRDVAEQDAPTLDHGAAGTHLG